jgi:DNA-directed RNA polymerase subunit RPC12/RpoP
MFSCSTCAKTFQAQQSLKQHMEATGHILCNECGKGFYTLESLSQHEGANGHSKSKQKKKSKKKFKKPSSPDPPFRGADGYWVKPSGFNGKKSFGYFKCKCNASWISAHAYSKYRQDCKTCNNSMMATLFWINHRNISREETSDNGEKDENKPHMRHLCEACKLGVCDMSISGRGVHVLGYGDY